MLESLPRFHCPNDSSINCVSSIFVDILHNFSALINRRQGDLDPEHSVFKFHICSESVLSVYESSFWIF